jgi:hypothetical protein
MLFFHRSPVKLRREGWGVRLAPASAAARRGSRPDVAVHALVGPWGRPRFRARAPRLDNALVSVAALAWLPSTEAHAFGWGRSTACGASGLACQPQCQPRVYWACSGVRVPALAARLGIGSLAFASRIPMKRLLHCYGIGKLLFVFPSAVVLKGLLSSGPGRRVSTRTLLGRRRKRQRRRTKRIFVSVSRTRACTYGITRLRYHVPTVSRTYEVRRAYVHRL